jgi:hypothetical protein
MELLWGTTRALEGSVTASFAEQEIWHVLVASDDMKRMNVDQLDDAFRLSLVDASTLVWKAGMKTWQSLGSVAGLEDEEPQTITKQMNAETLAQLMHMPPPAPRPASRILTPAPPPRPAPRSLPPAPPRPLPRSLPPSPPRPAPAAAFQAQQFAAPLVATPMYVPQLVAPDPYVLPKRRVQVPSEVDFRRRSGGVRIGRWLCGFLLLTVGVLACYRQNLLRDGARRIGLENKYLYGEKRATAFVTAKAPKVVQNALTRLALLPGPNATPVAPAAAAVRLPAAAPVAAAAPTEPAKAEPAKAEPAKAAASSGDADVKTVSLDSLPVLGNQPAPEAGVDTTKLALAKPAPAAKTTVAVKTAPVSRRAAARAEAAEQPAKKAKPEPKAAAPKPEPKPVAKEAPPPANESFLKAAIRSAIAADTAKGK